MKKLISIMVATLFCGIFAAMPEFILFNIYGLIHPASELSRTLTLLAFVFCGGGICIGFLALAVYVWLILIGMKVPR